jgi:aarF domain-containing kinase
MIKILATGRFCLGQFRPPVGNYQSARFGLSSATRATFRSPHTGLRFLRIRHHNEQSGRRSYASARVLWASAGALTPAAFFGIMASSDENKDSDKTGEELMLEQSRAELAEAVPSAISGSSKYRRKIYFFIDEYFWEPICTGFRFLHLVVIFVPVILTIPAIWIGERVKDRDDERSGTLWWYGFLVSSMERAGAAFIKVSSRP